MLIERTFFVKIELDDQDDLQAVADDIQDILETEGFGVLEVKLREDSE